MTCCSDNIHKAYVEQINEHIEGLFLHCFLDCLSCLLSENENSFDCHRISSVNLVTNTLSKYVKTEDSLTFC